MILELPYEKKRRTFDHPNTLKKRGSSLHEGMEKRRVGV